MSCHQPLTRLLTSLLSKLYLLGIQFSDITQLDVRAKQLWLLERPLTCLIFKAQVENQMWKKNGNSLAFAINNYHTFMCNEMYCRDICLLQVMSNILPPRTILMCIMNKFRTGDWFDNSYGKKTLHPDSLMEMHQLVEETLSLIITILIDRNNPDLAMLTEEESLEQSIINLLFIDSWTHSDLEKELHRGNESIDHTSDPIVDTLLKKLANISTAKNTTKFTLKKEFYPRVSIFFYHDSKGNFSKAVEKRRSLSKTSHDDAILVSTLPLIPEFRPHMCGLLQLLNNDVIFAILSKILDRTLHNKALVSEFIVQQALFLIALGIEEDRKKNTTAFTNVILGLSGGQKTRVNFIYLFNELKKSQEYVDSFHLINWILAKLVPSAQVVISEPSEELTQAEKNREFAKKRQEELKMKMFAKQKKFLEQHKVFTDAEPLASPINLAMTSPMNIDIPDVGIGIHCMRNLPSLDQELNCVICHANTPTSSEGATNLSQDLFVLPVHISLSTILNKMRGTLTGSYLTSCDLSLPNTNLKIGLLSKSCGHALHFSCYEQHTKSKKGNQKAFLCPLCSDNFNTFLPVSHSLEYNATEYQNILDPTFETFLTLLVQLKNNNCNVNRFILIECTNFSKAINIFPLEPSLAQNCINHDIFSDLPNKASNIGFNNRDTDINPFLDTDHMLATEHKALSLWNTVSYTILAKCNEFALSGQDILTNLNEFQISFLRTLIHSAVNANSAFQFRVCQAEAIKMIRMIISSQPRTDKQEIASFLNLDAFSLLVNMQMSFPLYFCSIMSELEPNISLALFPTLSVYIFKLMLLFRIAQIIMLLANKDTDSSGNSALPQYEPLLKLWNIYQMFLPGTLSTHYPKTVNIDVLQQELSTYLFPFLQSSALFYQLMFGVSLPLVDPTLSCISKVDILLKYLDCENLMSFIDKSIMTNTQSLLLLQNWFVECAEMSLLFTSGIPALSQIIPPYGGLINLHTNYVDVLKLSQQHYCPTTNNKTTDAAICLICGKLLCSGCYACTENSKTSTPQDSLGPCCKHIIECSGSIGMMLMIRHAYVLLLNITTQPTLSVSGCLHDAPYLDKFGQPDMFLSKGYPLTLSEKHYSDLNNIWLHNNVSKQIRMQNEEYIMNVYHTWSHF